VGRVLYAGPSAPRADELASAGSLGTVAGDGSLQSHGQFDVVSERNRKTIAGRGPDAGEVFRAVIRVVCNDESAAAQATLKQREYGQIETLRPIEQNKIDESGRSRASVCSASPSRISTKSDRPAGVEVGARPRYLPLRDNGGGRLIGSEFEPSLPPDAAKAILAGNNAKLQHRCTKD
jgi:hypothetical protein